PDEISDVLDLWTLVVVGENHGVPLASAPLDLRLQLSEVARHARGSFTHQSCGHVTILCGGRAICASTGENRCDSVLRVIPSAEAPRRQSAGQFAPCSPLL